MKRLRKILIGVGAGSASIAAMGYPLISHAFFWDFTAPRNVQVPPGQVITLGTLGVWINNVANFLLTVGIILAIIFIIWGGIMYMAAGGNSEKAEKAKTRIWNGVIGALIVLGVGVILRTLMYLVQQGVTS